MQALKDTEQFLGMEHVETGSVVADEIGRVPLANRCRELDARRIARSGELPRIAEQILEHHPEQPPIAFRNEIGRDRGLDAPIRLGALQLEIDAAGQCAQVDPLVPKLVSRPARQCQQSVDQLRHGLGRLTDVSEILLSLTIESFAMFIQQYLAEAV